jgi:hypothetical protein
MAASIITVPLPWVGLVESVPLIVRVIVWGGPQFMLTVEVLVLGGGVVVIVWCEPEMSVVMYVFGGSVSMNVIRLGLAWDPEPISTIVRNKVAIALVVASSDIINSCGGGVDTVVSSVPLLVKKNVEGGGLKVEVITDPCFVVSIMTDESDDKSLTTVSITMVDIWAGTSDVNVCGGAVVVSSRVRVELPKTSVLVVVWVDGRTVTTVLVADIIPVMVKVMTLDVGGTALIVGLVGNSRVGMIVVVYVLMMVVAYVIHLVTVTGSFRVAVRVV